ncbi:hypothetical protein [Paradevosia shaoguanensis]|uniref:CHRD domain-containing protein n=1 Tax=Paradevosia shaoguanensis TaxID=1335043 RepID=A0AA41QJV3_9HYPH|nr:hypothetical protein [Paradevosia shaoguanensis]MCF1740995.1 hypothetical protein [Paradevosia shaoguanensis]MCI0125478.1 hypothetical protein [Paradevosia shaoguanensis]
MPSQLLAWVVLVLMSAAAASGEEPGWHFSPLAGEGDRAAMGCTIDTTSVSHTCIVVRCADDFSVALHLHTSRAGGPAGRWELTLDRQSFPVNIVADATPYGARVEGDATGIIEGIEQGETGYIEPLDGARGNSSRLPLKGSLQTIRQALYFCAPRTEVGQETPAGMVAPVPQKRPQTER